MAFDKDLPILICDDVLSTGNSMDARRKEVVEKNEKGTTIIGVVVFARGKCPDWITPLFSMSDDGTRI